MRPHLLNILIVVVCVSTRVLSQSMVDRRRMVGPPFPRVAMAGMMTSPQLRPPSPVHMAVTPLGDRRLLVRTVNTQTGQWMTNVVRDRRRPPSITRQEYWARKMHLTHKRDRITAALARTAALRRNIQRRNMIRMLASRQRFHGIHTNRNRFSPISQRRGFAINNQHVRMFGQGQGPRTIRHIERKHKLNRPVRPFLLPIRPVVNVVTRQPGARLGRPIVQVLGLREIRDNLDDDVGDKVDIIGTFENDGDLGSLFEADDDDDSDGLVKVVNRGRGGIAGQIMGPVLRKPNTQRLLRLGPVDRRSLVNNIAVNKEHQINKQLARLNRHNTATSGVLSQIRDTKENNRRVLGLREIRDNLYDDVGDKVDMIGTFENDGDLGLLFDSDDDDDSDGLVRVVNRGRGGIAGKIMGPVLRKPNTQRILRLGSVDRRSLVNTIAAANKEHKINKQLARLTRHNTATSGVLSQSRDTKANNRRVVDLIMNADIGNVGKVVPLDRVVDGAALGVQARGMLFNPLAGDDANGVIGQSIQEHINNVNEINSNVGGIANMAGAKSSVGILGQQRDNVIEGVTAHVRPNVIRVIGGIDDSHDDDDGVDDEHVSIKDAIAEETSPPQDDKTDGLDIPIGISGLGAVLFDLGISGATDHFGGYDDQTQVLPVNPNSSEHPFANGIGENGFAILGIDPKTVDFYNTAIRTDRSRNHAIHVGSLGADAHPPSLALPNKWALPLTAPRVLSLDDLLMSGSTSVDDLNAGLDAFADELMLFDDHSH